MTNERDALNTSLIGAKNDLKNHQDAMGITDNHEATNRVQDSLHGIQYALCMVHDTADIGLTPKADQAEALQIIHTHVHRIIQAIQRVEEPPAEHASLHGCCPVNMLDLVRNGCDLCKAHCLKAGIEMVVVHDNLVDPMVMGDPNRLNLALIHVIAMAVNALHHTKGEVKVELKSDTMTIENKCVPALSVRLSCNSQVSNEESMPHAMPLSFSQNTGAPSIASNASIVKRIVRQHHGEMTVVDAYPQGVRIDLSIPCQLQHLAHHSYQAPHVPLFELDDTFFEASSRP
jgi:signal transduction histidine kinase